MKKFLIAAPFAPLLVAAAFGGFRHLPADVRYVAEAAAAIDIPPELAVGPFGRYEIAVIDADHEVYAEFSVTSVARPTVQCTKDGRHFLTYLCVLPVVHDAPCWPLPKGWFYDIREVAP